jgi:hypothetical protein
MPIAAQSVQILEQRVPGSPMKTLNLKVPEEVLEQLRLCAERMHCHRSALGRALLIKGLRELSETEGPDWF